MTTIDQRIMIPAPLETVWTALIDPASMSRWDRTSAQVTPLNQQTGLGARRRCVDSHGQSRVEEITAWLEFHGYEYKAVESIYQVYTGRMRLQAVPDGTQLQWTLTYQLGGALGGIRDALGYQRSLRAEMADSLRALRKQIEASGIHFVPTQHAKVTMQADPGFAARQARAGSAAMAASRLAEVTDATRIAPISTPTKSNPLARPIDPSDPDADLPPLEAVQAAPPTVRFAPPTPHNPAPIIISEPPFADEDTRQTTARRAAQDASPAVTQITVRTPDLPPSTPASDDTPPRPIRRDELPSTIIARRELPLPISTPPAPVPPPVQSLDGDAPPADPVAETITTESSDASVWDIFGVERPGQRPRSELDSLIADLRTPPPAKAIGAVRAFDRPSPPIVPESPIVNAPDTDSQIAPERKASPRSGKVTVRVRQINAQNRGRQNRKATVRIRRIKGV